MIDTKSLRHPLTRALIVLTFTTGIIDAASFIGLGHVFTANMTGNVVLLGFGLAGGAGLPVLAPLVSLAAFLLGATLGGRLGLRSAVRTRPLAHSMAIEIGLLALAAVIALAFDVTPDHVSGDLVIALLAFAMGVRNAAVRQVKVTDLTTTVLTMTLTGLAADSPAAGGDGQGSFRRVAAVVAMLIGAIIGGLLLKAHLAADLGLAALLAVLIWATLIPAALAAEKSERSATLS